MLKATEEHSATANARPEPKSKPRSEWLRHHVISRMKQERSGRLYCSEDLEIEVPSLLIYEAR